MLDHGDYNDVIYSSDFQGEHISDFLHYLMKYKDFCGINERSLYY